MSKISPENESSIEISSDNLRLAIDVMKQMAIDSGVSPSRLATAVANELNKQQTQFDSNTPTENLVVPQTDQPLSNENRTANPEKLPAHELILPFRVFAKHFLLDGMPIEWEGLTSTRNVWGDWSEKRPRLDATTLEMEIVDSAWRVAIRKEIKPANLQAPRPTIYGFVGMKQAGPVHFVANEMLDGDAEFEFYGNKGVQNQRPFVHIESRALKGSEEKIAEMLSQGLPVWSAMTPNERIIFFRKNNGNFARLSNQNNRKLDLKNYTETLTVSDQPNLWSDRLWLDDDRLVTSIATAYQALKEGKGVDFVKVMPNGAKIDEKTAVLIAQALSQMVVTKGEKLPYWVTDGNVLAMPDKSIVFTSNVIRKNTTIVDSRKIVLNEQNREIVGAIRQAFSKPIPEAMDEWKRKNI